MNQRLPRCPVCNGELMVTRLQCQNCDISIEGQFLPGRNPFAGLSDDQMQFLTSFIRCEGKFNRLEEELHLSYPTLKNRFNDILRSMGFEPGREETPVRLSADERRKVLEDLDQGKINWNEAQARLSGKKETVTSDEQEKAGAQ